VAPVLYVSYSINFEMWYCPTSLSLVQSLFWYLASPIWTLFVFFFNLLSHPELFGLKVWLTDQPIGIEKGKRWQSRHSKTITYCTNVYSYTSNHNTGKKTLKPYSSGCDSKLKKNTNRVQIGLARYQNKLCTRDNEVGQYHISKFRKGYNFLHH
jgi:hypothetical protein